LHPDYFLVAGSRLGHLPIRRNRQEQENVGIVGGELIEQFTDSKPEGGGRALAGFAPQGFELSPLRRWPSHRTFASMNSLFSMTIPAQAGI
jgi:hypothetical protein